MPPRTDTPAKAKAVATGYGDFAKRVSDATGIDTDVLVTWIIAEGNGPFDNPLNIMDPATHKPRRFGTPAAAADATIKTLRTNATYAPLLRAAANPKAGPKEQFDALAASGWDACHYRGTLPNGTCANAKPGSLLYGVWTAWKGGAPLPGASGAVAADPPIGGAAGALGGTDAQGNATGLDLGGAIGGVESWLTDKAIVALAYLVLTLGALALILLGLSRATGITPASVRGGRARSGPGGFPKGY